MRFLVLCFLLAAGTCLAGVYRANKYSIFYSSLPDDCKCFIILPVDGSLACSVYQYSVAGWLTIEKRASHLTG